MNEQPARHSFESIEERDAWISEHHPERECLDVPGLYNLPDGGKLGVISLRVTVYPAPYPVETSLGG